MKRKWAAVLVAALMVTSLPILPEGISLGQTRVQAATGKRATGSEIKGSEDEEIATESDLGNWEEDIREETETKGILETAVTLESNLLREETLTYEVPETNAILSYEITDKEEITILDCNENVSGDITIPGEIDGYRVTQIADSAFRYCGFNRVTLPSTIDKVGEYTFYDCDYLKEVSLKNTGLVSLSANMFAGDNELARVVLPSQLQEIGERAFYWCNQMTAITLPKSVTTIEDSAFEGCQVLSDVYYEGSEDEWNEIAIGTKNDRLTGATFHFDSESLSDGGAVSSGWYNGNFYQVVDTSMTWTEAAAFCEMQGGHLVTITSQGEQAFIESLLMDDVCTKKQYWIGARFMDDGYQWITGEEFSYTNWDYRQPDRSAAGGERESFAQILNELNYAYEAEGSQRFKWNDIFEDNIYPGQRDFFDTCFVGLICEWDGYDPDIKMGTLEAIDIVGCKLTIDGVAYDVTGDLQLSDAVDIWTNYSDKRIIFSLLGDKIERYVSVQDCLVPRVEIRRDYLASTGGIKYLNGVFEYNTRTRQVYVDVRVDSSVFQPEELLSFSDLFLNLDKLKLSVGDQKINWGETGLFHEKQYQIEKEINETIYLGEKKTYEFDYNINDDYIPSSVRDTCKVEVEAEIGGNTVKAETTIVFANMDQQKETAETKPQNTKSELEEVKSALDRFTIAFNADLNEYLTADQQKQLKKCLTLWVGEVFSSLEVQEDLKDNVRKKVLKKLGVSLETNLNIKNVTANTKIQCQTKKGEKTFNFSLKLLTGAYGSESLDAAWGSLTYTIDDDPRVYSGSQIAYTDCEGFVEKLNNLAVSTIKDCYNSLWGSSANKVADMLIDKNIMDIINDRYGSFSDGVFTLITKPTMKCVSQKCPVDVYVYDMNGNLCGQIVNNVVDESFDEILMAVDGDEKYCYLIGADYKVKMVGNGSGTMEYSVEEYGLDGESVRTIHFYDIPLTDGKTYEAYVYNAANLPGSLYGLLGDSETFLPDSDSLTQEEMVYVNGISLNFSSITLKKGESKTLSAAVTPGNATFPQVDWSSADEGVATVDCGVVKAIRAGETVITAESKDGAFTVTCAVKILDDSDGNEETGGGSEGNSGGNSGGGSGSSGSGGSSGGSSGGGSGGGGGGSSFSGGAAAPGGPAGASGTVSTDPKKGQVNSITGIITGDEAGYSRWMQDKYGWKFLYADGTYAAGSALQDEQGQPYEQIFWEQINGAWFAFGADQYLKTGFVYDRALAGWFYVDVNTGMQTGWAYINDKWYYFNPVSDGTRGILYVDQYTPDGYYVDSAGVWVQ